MALKFSSKFTGPSIEIEGVKFTFKRISSRAIASFMVKSGINSYNIDWEKGNLTNDEAEAMVELQAKFMADNLIAIKGLIDEDTKKPIKIDDPDFTIEVRCRLMDLLLDRDDFLEFSDAYKSGTEKKSVEVSEGEI